MFIDEVMLEVQSGKGGDGIIAFRREKHVPLGGPSGGDGGKGGSVIFQADEGISTLYDLKFQKHIRAKAGENGKAKNMRGKDAEDVIIKVPVGSIIYEAGTNIIIADLTTHLQTETICKGGKGGRGNSTFASSRNKAPRIQENGEPGVTVELRIELKLLADVGIIGFPSVGKSTLISVVSGSRPKIAEYPFTTIIPNLGVVEMPPIPAFVLADMPGIIEGASSGLGLGLQFLKHIERTRVLLHMIDMSESSGRDPYSDYQIINNELKTYKFHLSERPQIIVASKMDLPGAEQRLEKFKLNILGTSEIVPISSAKMEGIKELIQKTYNLLEKTPLFPISEKPKVEDDIMYKYVPEETKFIVEKLDESTYSVQGRDIEKLYQKTNFMTDEALARFLRQLRKMGVDDLLRKSGAKNGDIIKIMDFELEFFDQ